MTKAHKAALLWLRNRNADGVFDRNGVLLAGGDRAPVMRSTWNALRRDGFVELYGPTFRRLRLTEAGMAADLRGVADPGPADRP